MRCRLKRDNKSSIAALLQKSAFNTVMICAGPVADDRNLIASVTKHGEKKAIIEVKGATHYFAEGDLFDRNFKITKGTQVAQVLSRRSESALSFICKAHQRSTASPNL